MRPQTASSNRLRCLQPCSLRAPLWPPNLVGLQVLHPLTSARIHEAMGINAAAASVGGSKHREALEAEARVAVPAEHLVALLVLSVLVVQVLLCDGHPASGTLLCPAALDPLQETLIVVLHLAVLAVGLAVPLLPLRGVGRAAHAFVVRLRTAAQAGGLLAHRAVQQRTCTFLQGHAHGAVRGGACPEVGGGINCPLEAAGQDLLHELVGQDPSQVLLRQALEALRAGDVWISHLQPRLRMSLHALGAVPAVLAAQLHRLVARLLVAADGARHAADVPGDGIRARAGQAGCRGESCLPGGFA
mmetsp:Transcript_38859/g.91463  ORF Transcript_38859/g.91463 Transcript_38859/m.91463 type:complete len:302 (-) Transcript_38859:551-1456(-)